MENGIVHRRKHVYNGKDKKPGDYKSWCGTISRGANSTQDMKYINCGECLEQSIGDFQAKIEFCKDKLTRGEVY